MPVSPRIRAIAAAALEHARRDPAVEYAEVRWVDERKERLRIRDGAPDGISQNASSGFGVRVLARGAWGFACTPRAEEAAVVRAIDDATAIARASARLAQARAVLRPAEPQRGRYTTPLEVDPFKVPLEQKLGDLARAEAELRRGGGAIRSAEAAMSWTEIDKLLLTSEGTDVEQHFVYGGAGLQAHAIGDDGGAQRRSFPGSPGTEVLQGGYEIVAQTRLAENAPRVRDEAIALLTAPPCPEGLCDVILGSNQMALQIHESCGHPTELDRALGAEISLAGGSFLQPGQLGKLRYGSPIVTLTADATTAGGLGSFGWDDEGTPARKTALVEDGIFTDYLSSRETAAALGRRSTGTVRASSWNRLPMIRMINVSLEPRQGSLDELVADTADGVLFDVNQSWSIDDLRLNFQFSCEVAWEIKHGKRTRLFRDARYTGSTPEFWRSCDAICGPGEARIWGIDNCGKGDPMQTMQVAHRAPPARFRRIEVGHS